ncbi:hypothetical protein [Gynuella sunshinyii]|uniref:Rhs family protein n=1 Tax=Gynuella sunshinyii YC6258 TaxID=1445510 RepID=A0A0C5VGM3_9GAMM|nr:hypothetical protein [Gynuella sunshinyii]AJQ93346.1 hypothetical Protein YC6258_01298 [Gynuella sunshinyii YC6258]
MPFSTNIQSIFYANGQNLTRFYDKQNRLIDQKVSGNGKSEKIAYQYDSVANIRQQDHYLNDNLMDSKVFSYGAGSRLSSVAWRLHDGQPLVGGSNYLDYYYDSYSNLE